MKVYAEHGALRAELVRLDRGGAIELVTFPYENKNRNIGRVAAPSAAQIRHLNLPIGKMKFRIGDMRSSDQYRAIVEIIGQANIEDALHIDSAYKSGCRAFFSRDSKHIIRKAKEIHDLLGIRVFHPDKDWDEFLTFLQCETRD